MIMINDDDDDCQSRGRLPGSQNRLKIDRGTFLGGPVAAKSVQAASRERLGRFQEHPESLQRRLRTPEKAPRSTRERAEATRIDAKSCPGTKKIQVFLARLVREAASL